jgi:hypothetical protein
MLSSASSKKRAAVMPSGALRAFFGASIVVKSPRTALRELQPASAQLATPPPPPPHGVPPIAIASALPFLSSVALPRSARDARVEARVADLRSIVRREMTIGTDADPFKVLVPYPAGTFVPMSEAGQTLSAFYDALSGPDLARAAPCNPVLFNRDVLQRLQGLDKGVPYAGAWPTGPTLAVTDIATRAGAIRCSLS